MAQGSQIILTENGARHTLVGAQNGIPVININTPNAAGVSVNQYQKFNVGPQGAVLNNAPIVMGEAGVTSRLAGSIPVNPNITRPANLIINEVVANNPSILNGYLEVAGRSADVVVANPWGISCGGCGFINAPRVTLTTGAPSYDLNGGLSGFSVEDGSIEISGNGFDASRVNVLDIVARSIHINGPIFAKDLGITAGKNQFNYLHRNALLTQSDGGANPSLAIDASVLGGMYANKIKLVATDHGVGVRMDRSMASTTEDFTLSSSGQVVLSGAISTNSGLTPVISNSKNTPLQSHAIRPSESLAPVDDAVKPSNSISRQKPTIHISSAEGVSNSGSIFSEGDLIINANELNNAASGGMVAARELNLEVGSGGIVNSGALYAGQSLKAATAGRITNVGSLSSAIGTIDSVGDIEITAAQLMNNSAINARQNIRINASVINNEVMGGDTRRWVGSSEFPALGGFMPEYLGTERWYEFPDRYKKDSYQITWRTSQVHSGGTPSYRPQIVAGEGLSVAGFESATNVGGILSANTINLVGKNTHSTFTNNDLSLQENTYRGTYDLLTRYVALGPLNYYENKFQNWRSSLIESKETSSVGASIAANNIAATGFNLDNRGSPVRPTLSLEAGANVRQGVSGASTQGGNPNAYFVRSLSPASNYLIEVNPKYLNLRTIESEAVLESLGQLAPANNQRLLGAPAYTNQIVLEQMMVLTNGQMLGHTNENQLLNTLATNAIIEGRQQGMVVGVAPTQSQLDRLERDIVWFVSENVGGEMVLTPQVYLSKAGRGAVVQGAVIDASNSASLNIESLRSEGANIIARQTLDIRSQNNIENIGGNILAENILMRSEFADVENRRPVITGPNSSSILGEASEIHVKNKLDIHVQGDLKNEGSRIISGGNTEINAGHNIVLDVSKQITDSVKHSSTNGGSNPNMDTQTTESHSAASILDVGGNLDVTSNSFDQVGSDVSAAGNAKIMTRNNVQIRHSTDTIKIHTTSHESGFGLNGNLYGTRNIDAVRLSENVKRPTLNVGGNLSIKSDGAIQITGAQQHVGVNATFDARSVKFLVAENTNSETSDISSLGVLGPRSDMLQTSGGNVQPSSNAADAKAGFNLFSSDRLRSRTTQNSHISTDLAVGRSLNIKAKSDATFIASNINVAEDTKVSAGGAIKFLAASDANQSSANVDERSFAITTHLAAKASADASASSASSSAAADASASADAKADNFIGYVDAQSNTKTADLKNFGGSLKSNGSISLVAQQEAILQSSSIEASGDIKVSAGDIKISQTHDTNSIEKTLIVQRAGIYGAANAGAGAAANAGASSTGVEASAHAGADASVGSGVEFGKRVQSTSSRKDKAVVTTIKSADTITQQATNKLEIEGAHIDAGGDVRNKAKSISIKAATNEDNEISSNAVDGIHFGVSAETNASAGAGAGVGIGGVQAQANAGASATVGVEAGNTHENSHANSNKTVAVAATINARKNLIFTSSEDSLYEGASLHAGGDVFLVGSTVNFLTANSSSTEGRRSNNLGAVAKAGTGVAAGAGVGASVAGSGAIAGAGLQESFSVNFSTANQEHSELQNKHLSGEINSNGSISIESTKGDVNIASAQINSKGNTSIRANRGSLKLTAERDVDVTSDSKSSAGFNVSAQAIEGAGGGVFAQGGGYGSNISNNARTIQSRGVEIHAGGRADLMASNDEILQATAIDAKASIAMTAGGNIDLQASQNLSSTRKQGEEFGIGAAGDRSGGLTSANVDLINSGTNSQKNNNVKLSSPTVVARSNNFSQTGHVLDAEEIRANTIRSHADEKENSYSWDSGLSLNNGVPEGALPTGGFQRAGSGEDNVHTQRPGAIKYQFENIISTGDKADNMDWKISKSIGNTNKSEKIDTTSPGSLEGTAKQDNSERGVYRSRVVVNLQPKDMVTTKAAEDLANKYPNSILVNIDDNGVKREVKGSLSNFLGDSKVSVVGHASEDPNMLSVGGYSPEQLANIVSEVAPVSELKKVSLVSCEGAACAREVSEHFINSGWDIKVSGPQGPIKVSNLGGKRPASKDDPYALGRKSSKIKIQGAVDDGAPQPVELLSARSREADRSDAQSGLVTSDNHSALRERGIVRSDLPINMEGLVEKGYSPPSDDPVGKYVYRLDSRPPTEIMREGFAGSNHKKWFNKIYDEKTVFTAKTVRGVYSYGLESVLNRSGERVEMPGRAGPIFRNPSAPPPLKDKDVYLYKIKIADYEHIEVMKDVNLEYPKLQAAADPAQPKIRYFEANNFGSVSDSSVLLAHTQRTYESSMDDQKSRVARYARTAAAHTEEVIVKGPIHPVDIEFIQKLPAGPGVTKNR